jgi:hypothetical protein
MVSESGKGVANLHAIGSYEGRRVGNKLRKCSLLPDGWQRGLQIGGKRAIIVIHHSSNIERNRFAQVDERALN